MLLFYFRRNKDNALNEVRALVNLKHKNIVGYITTWSENLPEKLLKKIERDYHDSATGRYSNTGVSSEESTTNRSTTLESSTNSTREYNIEKDSERFRSLPSAEAFKKSDAADHDSGSEDEDYFEKNEAREENSTSDRTENSQMASSSTSLDDNTENVNKIYLLVDNYIYFLLLLTVKNKNCATVLIHRHGTMCERNFS